jgi:hypothetical protein
LGHVISKEGMAMDATKVAAVQSWPQPRSARGLRGFLGLSGYYRHFIKDYGTIAAALTQLLRKEGFRWSEEAGMALSALKAALCSAPVLQLPDFAVTFFVDCDASGFGFGAVLHQDGRPIAFFSRPFAAGHLKTAAYERELIGLVQAVRHWRPYLWGRAFVVRTDHYALKFMLDQRLSTIPQHHWVSKLFGYDFSVEYRPGKGNGVADALSRRDGDVPLLADVPEAGAFMSDLSTPAFQLYDDIRQELAADEALRQHRDAAATGELGLAWTVRDGLVLYEGHVYVPAASACLDDVLQLAHIGRHEGIQRTLQRLWQHFHVEHDRRIVGDFVRSCPTCQRNKMETLHPGLLQPLPVPSRICADISIDFVEALPKVHGKSVLLTVVDRFSKYAHFIALGHPYTVSSVARAFFQEIVCLHGFPESIVSDRDPVFTGHVWRDLFRHVSVKLRMSTAFHPQTDGQSEVVNKIITMYLRCLTGDRPRDWLDWLPWAEFCYNTAYHTALQATPFQVVYGRAPPALLPYTPGTAHTEAVDTLLTNRDEFLEEVRTRQALHLGGRGKLGPKYAGFFQVLERVGDVAYRLRLPDGAWIHDVFHVGVLKPFRGPPQGEPVLPPLRHGQSLQQPDKVLRSELRRGVWHVSGGLGGHADVRGYMGTSPGISRRLSVVSARGQAVS